MNEHLLQAHHGANFVISDLQSALNRSNAVEAIILLPMIEAAALLAQQLATLIAARAAP